MPDNHEIYVEHKRLVSYLPVTSLTSVVKPFNVCPGLLHNLPAEDPVSGIFEVTKHTDPHCAEVYCDDGPPFQVTVYLRSKNCVILCDSGQDMCTSCSTFVLAEVKQQNHSAVTKATAVNDKHLWLVAAWKC